MPKRSTRTLLKYEKCLDSITASVIVVIISIIAFALSFHTFAQPAYAIIQRQTDDHLVSQVSYNTKDYPQSSSSVSEGAITIKIKHPTEQEIDSPIYFIQIANGENNKNEFYANELVYNTLYHGDFLNVAKWKSLANTLYSHYMDGKDLYYKSNSSKGNEIFEFSFDGDGIVQIDYIPTGIYIALAPDVLNMPSPTLMLVTDDIVEFAYNSNVLFVSSVAQVTENTGEKLNSALKKYNIVEYVTKTYNKNSDVSANREDTEGKYNGANNAEANNDNNNNDSYNANYNDNKENNLLSSSANNNEKRTTSNTSNKTSSTDDIFPEYDFEFWFGLITWTGMLSIFIIAFIVGRILKLIKLLSKKKTEKANKIQKPKTIDSVSTETLEKLTEEFLKSTQKTNSNIEKNKVEIKEDSEIIANVPNDDNDIESFDDSIDNKIDLLSTSKNDSSDSDKSNDFHEEKTENNKDDNFSNRIFL